MKNFKKVLALVLVVAMALSFATMSSAAFTDAESIEKAEAVAVLSTLGVINGFEDGSFKPEGDVTRAEMAKMLAYIMNSGEDVGEMYAGACTFADSANHWAAGYIAYCAQEGLINGKNATTFAPDAKVTGTEAAKMILGALGHDGETAGMIGSAWASTALSLAKKANLIGALNNLTCNMNQPLSRQNAAQMLLNGLKATMVEYTGGSKITIGDVTMTQGATASDVKAAAGLGFNGINDQLVQLAEEKFGAGYGNLKVQQAQTDVFGRTCNVWNYDNEVIGSFAVAPTLSYNTGVSLHQVYTDLGKVAATDLSAPATYYVDGAANVTKAALVASDLKSGSVDSFIGGQGVKTEVYYDALTETLNIVEINTYAGMVIGQTDAVRDANGDVVTEAYIVVGNTAGTSLAGTIAGGALLANDTYAPAATVKSDAFTKADIGKTVVYYTKGVNADQSNYVQIQSVAKATEVTGTVKGLAAFGGNTTDITLDATNYKVNATMTGLLSANLIDTPVKAYLDANGNVIFQTGVASEDYALVLASGTEQQFASTYSAQLLFQDGTVKVVTLAPAHDDGVNVPGNNTIATYVVGADGTYTLTAQTTGTVSSVDASNNNVTAVVTGQATLDSSYYANANTTFTVGVKDLQNVTTYTAYTGIAAVPSFAGKVVSNTATPIYYVMNAQGTAIAAVFCTNADVLGAAAENAMMLYKTGIENLTAVSKTNSYYTVAAVVDGAVTSVKVNATAYANLSTGINLFSMATTDINGNYASFGTSGLNSSSYTAFTPYVDGVIGLDGTATVVAATLPAYVWNLTTKKLVATTVDTLYALEGTFHITRAATLAAPINAIFAVVK